MLHMPFFFCCYLFVRNDKPYLLIGLFLCSSLIHFMCICVPACMYLHYMYVVPRRPEEGIGSSKIVATESCQ